MSLEATCSSNCFNQTDMNRINRLLSELNNSGLYLRGALYVCDKDTLQTKAEILRHCPEGKDSEWVMKFHKGDK